MYGGHLIAAVLPPLDAGGERLQLSKESSLGLERAEIRLGTGLDAFLVRVPALSVYSPS